MKGLMKIILVVFVFLMNEALHSQPITWEKVLTYTRNSTFEKAYQTSDGGYIAAGSNVLGNDTKMYIVKFNRAGDTVWTRFFNTSVSGVYHAYWIEQTEDGGFIIAGDGSGSQGGYLVKTDSLGNVEWFRTFGGFVGQAWCVRQLKDKGYIVLVRNEGVSSDIKLIKYNSFGDLIWNKVYGSDSLNEHGTEIQVLNNSGFIISGLKRPIQGNNPSNLYLMRTDSNGDTLWTKTFNTYLNSVAESIDLVNNGGFIVAGFADSTNHNEPNSYVVRTDSLGNIIWQKRYTSIYKERSHSIRTLPNDNYVFCGTSDSTDGGYEKAFVRIINDQGVIQIEKFYRGGKFANNFQSVELTNDGGLILCGYADNMQVNAYIVKTDSTGNVKPVGISSHNEVIEDFVIYQNYPNPFNPTTTISYELPEFGFVELKIYDLTGKEIMNLENGYRSQGIHTVTMNATNFPSGVYFCKIKAGDFVAVKKMVLVK